MMFWCCCCCRATTTFPKLRAAPFHACLRAYERAVLDGLVHGPEDDGAHFFHYTQNERRQWNAPFAATFFEYLRKSRPRTPTLYDSFDLRDLHERNQTEDIMNLRFDLKEGAASPDEWRCEAVCKEIKEAATAPTNKRQKKRPPRKCWRGSARRNGRTATRSARSGLARLCPSTRSAASASGSAPRR